MDERDSSPFRVLLVLGFGGQKANEVVISRLRIKSLEDSIV